MDLRRTTTHHRRADRIALGGLRIALAATFAALGWGLLALPGFEDGAARLGLGAGGRILLGVSHLAVGVALLATNPAAGAACWLGALVVWATVRWLPEDLRVAPVGPCLLTLALLALVVAAGLRRREADAAWRSMLTRYAEGRGPGRSK
ncbi:hypothetical protein [Paludisphaera mucosa]|uniref:Uncharacterized protein n=1 Tax=Paludisphaera mucosa TaxID=3030827 RepID=A0ABT6FL19_9BACT|nr:hypothetical protein [Paludisphaera mucosa]MDG3008214.1 hypothetical protein [Paludisphaera mucosa]